MFMRVTLVAAAAAAHLSSFAQAESTADIRLQLQQLREQYEARIKALEQRLDAAEKAQAAAAAPPAPPAAPAAPAPTPAPSPTPQAAPGLALSAVLTGTYANLRNDPETYRIQGFIPGGEELGPGSRSFSLGETELTLSANVDPYFSGRLTFAVTPENEAEVEEAYFRTTALAHGFTITGGRFLSPIGYLNNQHAHTWDFVDLPLAYQAFFGGQHRTDGVQLKWIAPTETYLELTGELGRGDSFPGSERNRNSAGSFSLGARIGRRSRRERELARGPELLARQERRPHVRGHRQHRYRRHQRIHRRQRQLRAGRRVQVGARRRPQDHELQAAGRVFPAAREGHAVVRRRRRLARHGRAATTARASRAGICRGSTSSPASGASACDTTG